MVIFCIPGSRFSFNFLRSWTQTISDFQNKSIKFLLSNPQSNNIYMVRNKCLGADVLRGKEQKPFDGKINYDYLMWIDSDMVWDVSQIYRLMSHNLDIVSGLYAWEGGQGFTCGKWDIDFFKENGYMPYYKPDDVPKELFEVDYTGFGFLLVKYGVFESLNYPWFTATTTSFNVNGTDIEDFAMEDVSWCLKVKEKGYKIFVDPTVRVGHEKTAIF